MSDGLVLFQNRLMSLAIFVFPFRISPLIQEKFRFIQVFFIPGHHIQLRQSHLGDLMSGHFHLLSGFITDLTANTVGIADRNIQKVFLSGSLIVSDSPFNHMPQVIKLVAQVFHFFPAFRSGPFMGVFRIHRPGSIQVSVRFLCPGNDHQHTVDIFFQFFIRIRLQQIAGPFDRFIHIGIVKSKSGYFIMRTGISGHFEILVASCFFAFTECQRNRHFTAGFQSLSPKGIVHFYSCKRNRGNGITGMSILLSTHTQCQTCGNKSHHSFFHKLFIYDSILFLFLFIPIRSLQAL